MDYRAGVKSCTSSCRMVEPRTEPGLERAPVSVCADTPTASKSFSTSTLQAEQAIFTSVRTAMGEGYRLIAVSPGISAEERAEITRRSPSHGSVCDSDPAAVAMASYRLASGRYCVAWVRYAGNEHTARGGLRVHAHMVVLDSADYMVFQCNPFNVLAALAAHAGEEPDIKSTALPRMALQADIAENADESDCRDAITNSDEELQKQAEYLAGSLQFPNPGLALTNKPTMELLKQMFALLRPADRAKISCSANLHYASSRDLQLICVSAITPEIRRAIQGRSMRIIDLSQDERNHR